MKKSKLYLLLAVLLAAGYAYLIAVITAQENGYTINTCIIKNATGIACPSCGSTRSVISIINGNFIYALLLNPLGYIVAAIMLIFPLWLLYDVLLKKQTLYNTYISFETTLKRKQVALPLLLLIAANWIWNIYKGL